MGTSGEISKISTSVDFKAVGTQHGHLVVPHSTNRSAWGSIEIPVSVIPGGTGPTAFFTGANHGDEYEGPIALAKLMHVLEPDQVQGTVIIMPVLNLPTFRAAQRLSPIDGMNINRVFLGDRNGTVTPMSAHFVSTQILPLADVVVDIHAGGKTLDFTPSAIIHELDDDLHVQKTLAALNAFGTPVALIFSELDAAGMLDTTVEEMGSVFISMELGGCGTATSETVAFAETGIRNILAHMGFIDEAPLSLEDRGLAPLRLMQTPDGPNFHSARGNGLYEPFKGLGDEVKEGDPLGQIHFIENSERQPLGPCGQSFRNDCLVVIGEDYRNT